MDEHELEQAVRAGLERRAAGADVTAPVVARARAEVSRRRRTRWALGGAAAAVVLVVGGIAVATGRGGDDTEQPPVVSDSTPTDVQPGRDGEWRTEYWAEVAVDVPADWAYGGAPTRSGGDVVACYPEAMIGADGRRLQQSGDRGWVGRPIAVTDVCAGYPWIDHSDQQEPSAPYVWLGADVEAGVVEYDNGYLQETVVVAGVAVTVASDDAALREEILVSAREQRICPARLDAPPSGRRESSVEGTGDFREGSVCAYRQAENGFGLSYAAPLDEESIEATWRELDAAPTVEDGTACQPDELVVVTGVYNDPYSSERELWLHWDAVFRTGCGTVDAGPSFGAERSRTVEMTAEMVEPWADNGIPAVVYGPSGGKGAMIDSFIGPQG